MLKNKRFEAQAVQHDEDVNFVDILSRTLDVNVWLENIGIKTDNSRLMQIIKDMKWFQDAFNNLLIEDKRKYYELAKKVENSAYEAFAFHTIKRGFEKLNHNYLPKEKLKQSIIGPDISRNENPLESNNHARNILFELELAAQFLILGFNVTGYEDINFKIQNLNVSIQCKRPFSNKTIKSNLEEANNQLINNNKINENNNKGLIAISFEKIYDLDKFIVVQNNDHLYQEIKKLIEDFIGKYKVCWEPYKNTNLIGLLLYIKTSVYYFDEEIFRNINSIIILPFKDINKLSRTHPDKIIYQNINEKLINKPFF